METAISLSSALFEKVEQTARYMGIPRGQLLAIALEDYINRYNGEMITKKINEVCEKVNQSEFSRDMDIGLESLRNFTKNDTW